MPVELLGKSAEELREFVVSLGEKPYRGPQIYHALYKERRFDFAAMTNLPAALRARLAEEARITLPRIACRFLSVDGSIRYLFSIGSPNGEEGAKPARSRLSSCRGMAARRFAFPRRRAAPWIAIFV